MMFWRKKPVTPQDTKKKPSQAKSAPKESMPARSKGTLLALESRLMFDAAATATAAEVNSEHVAQEQAEAAVSGDNASIGEAHASDDSDALLQALSTYMPNEARTEVVFVDPTVPNYQILLSGMDPHIDVIMLDSGADGIEQMASALAGRTGIDAVHVISHGDVGVLQLGTGTLTTESMAGQYADELAVIRQSLSESADILVYGCDFAEGQVGQEAATLLGQFTGADVAASTDVTGSAGLGGDWDLEVQTGMIETQVAISYDTQANWLELLSLTASGSETRVNTTTTGTQSHNLLGSVYTPDSVAMDASGNYVSVWESDGNICGQRYSSTGTAQGGEFVIANNAANERLASVAMSSSGAFVVTWERDQGTGYHDIYARQYTSSGTAVGSEFLVNETTTYDQVKAKVAMATDGSFAVVWSSNTESGGSYSDNLYAQRYDATGTKIGSNFMVNTTTSGDQDMADIAMDSAGNFVVVWAGERTADSYIYSIYGQRYNSSGVAQGGEFLVNAVAADNDQQASVAMNDSGNFVVTWERQSGGDTDIQAQRFNSAGVAQGSAISVASNASYNQDAVNVSMDGGGNFVVSWTSLGQDGSGFGVYTRQYDSTGTALTTESQVATTTTDTQDYAGVAYQNGKVVVIWSGNGVGDDSGIFMQRYTATGGNEAPIITSNGGGVTASINVAENTTSVTTVTATDANGQACTYSISGGADASKFTINSSTGALSFIAAPNYEAPTDSGGNNVYDVMVTVTDGNGGADTQSIAVTVTNVNDAPVLADTALTQTVTEDAWPIGAVGNVLSAFTGGITDVDGGAVKGLAIVGYSKLNGSWYYTTNGGTTWTEVGLVYDTSALLLADNPSTRLYFAPNQDYSGTSPAILTVRAWDQTSGAAEMRVSTVSNGGTTAFSSATDTIDVTVTAVNDAPVLADTALTVTVTEDAGVPIGTVGSVVSAFTGGITDVDSGAAKGLALTGTNATNGTWYYTTNGGTTWTAVGPVSNTSALLLADNASTRLYFAPNANYNGVSPAALTVRAWDQTSGTVGTKVSTASNGGTTAFSSATDTIDVTVTAVNDAPVLANTVLTVTVAEDAGAPSGTVGSLVSAFTGGITDVDSGAAKGLALTGTNATNGTWYYTTNGGTTWTAVGPVSNTSALLLADNASTRLYFAPNANYNGVSPAALTVRAWDQTSGTAGTKVSTASNGGTTAFSSATDTVDVTVTAVNDAPVLADTALTVTVTEDAGVPIGTVGSLVSAFTGGITDVDSGAAKGLALTGTNATNGTWYYTTNGGTTWTAVGPVSNTSALLLADNASTRLYFAPNANYNGVSPAALTVRAWDQTSGTVGTKVSTASNGGTTAFSSATDTVDVTVTAVNDAPVLTNTVLTVTVTEDAGVPIGTVGSLVSAFTGGITDVDSGAAKGLALTGTNATNGTWYYTTNGGTTWTAVGPVSNTSALLLADNASTRLYFAPNANYNGVSPAALTVRAWDQTSGTVGTKVSTASNGGTTAFSSATDTVDVTVTAVNDAPTSVGGSVTGIEDTAKVFSWSEFNISDIDTAIGADSAVRVSTLPSDGILQYYNGSTWLTVSVNQVLTKSTIDAGYVRFVPDANESGFDGYGTSGVGDGRQTYAQFNFIPVQTTAITITNPGGESQVFAENDWSYSATGWTSSGAIAGAYNPTTVDYANDQDNCLFTNAGGTLSQTLGTTFDASKSYSLSFEVGWRGSAGYPTPPDFRVEVWAGGTRLGYADQTAVTMVKGSFVSGTLAIDGTSLSALNGQALQVRLVGVSTQANFDNLSLTSFSPATDIGSVATMGVDITPVNDAPVNTVPGAQSTNEDTSKVFSAVNGNQISITDPDSSGGSFEVAVTVTNGTLTLSGTTGLTFTVGDGSSDSTMTFRGTVTDINGALNGLIYSPANDYNGGATLTITSRDNTLISLDVDADLQARYTFEGNANDVAPGTAQNGTLMNGATYVTDGTRGQVLSLDGVDDRVAISGLFGSPADVTLAAWVNLIARDTSGAEVISLGDNVVLRVDERSNGMHGAVYNGGGSWSVVTFNTTIAGSGWRHVAFSFSDGANLGTLYLDGVAVATSTINTSISYTYGLNSMIGAHASGSPDLDFHGLIDDARVYSRALSAAEVANLAKDLSLTDTDSVAITVNPVNDAPVLMDTALTVTVAEDAGVPIGTVGSVLSAFTGGITDVDSGAAKGLALTATNESNGTWYYTTNGGATWTAVGPVSNTSALLLADNASTRLYFAPNGDYNGTSSAALTVRAWDQTSGTAGTKVSTASNGGTTAFSSATDTVDVTVTAVNDAPMLVTNSGSIVAEGGTDTIGVNELAVVDVDHSASQLTYTIGTGPLYGRLELSTAPGIHATTFTQVDIAANRLLYIHDGSETTSDSFTFTVNDGAGGAVGPTTVTLTITPVNDTPTITSNGGGTTALISVAENVTSVTIVTGADVDLPAQSLTYSLSGGADQAQFTINTATGALSFVAPPDFEVATDANGDNVYVVQVQVTDSQGASTTQTIQVTVTDVVETSPPLPPPTVPPVLVSPISPPPIEGPTPGPVTPPSASSITSVNTRPVSSPVQPIPTPTPPPPVGLPVNVGPPPLVSPTDRPTAKVVEEPKTPSEEVRETSLFLVNDDSPYGVCSVEPVPILESDPSETKRFVSDLLMTKLDEMTGSLEQAAQASQEHHELMVRAAAVTGTTLSVGFVAWALRSGVMLASCLATMPAWRHFDPLPVVKLTRNERARRREEAARAQQQEAVVFKGLNQVLDKKPPLKRTA